MKFELSDDQALIQATAREFAQNEILPIAAELDRSGEFPVETAAKADELGFMGIEVPSEFGGVGGDAISCALVISEISAADAAHGTIVSVNNSLFGTPLLEYGTDDQKRRFLEPVASGKVSGAYALTEPLSGSDAGAMRARAKLSSDGSHYTIDGRKAWITSGTVAKYIMFFARTGDSGSTSAGISAFVIDTDEPGFSCGKTEPKLGIRGSATCEIELENYKCPVDQRIGDEGHGFKIAMSVLDSGRIGIAAQALGIAEAALPRGRTVLDRTKGIWINHRELSDDPGEDCRYEDADRGLALTDLQGSVEQA